MSASASSENYLSGFGNEFSTEAVAGALPRGQNSPQQCAYGLYAEQLSGTAFTAPRAKNKRSWLYRIRPSVRHGGGFAAVDLPLWTTAPQHGRSASLGAKRWDPVPVPGAPGAPGASPDSLDFISGMRTITTAGSADTRSGAGVHLYLVNAPMGRRYFYNADGEMLIVPQQGGMAFFTELGRFEVAPGEICVIPRGVKFSARPLAADGKARGYVCENYAGHFALPELGPIGANGLANARDFLTPRAAFEEVEAECELVVKWGGGFHAAQLPHSPLDVVAWHGNYAPYKYDLRRFSPVGSVLFDHPDPSIFTVLTAPSPVAGTANVDFVIFPDRWLVAEHSFRPPWYHVNIMSEFMGLIHGVYDAKPEGFAPGGMSLHNAMLPHGPDHTAFTRASRGPLKPQKLEGTLGFMFETCFMQHISDFAAALPQLQKNYADCWKKLDRRFENPLPANPPPPSNRP